MSNRLRGSADPIQQHPKRTDLAAWWRANPTPVRLARLAPTNSVIEVALVGSSRVARRVCDTCPPTEVHRTPWGNFLLADTSDLVGSAVLGDDLSRCLWEAAYEPNVGIFLDVGIHPVHMALTHGQYEVVPVNK